MIVAFFVVLSNIVSDMWQISFLKISYNVIDIKFSIIQIMNHHDNQNANKHVALHFVFVSIMCIDRINI